MAENKNWVATIKCTVLKRVVLNNCTKEEAEKNPWAHASDELEIDQSDWEVQSLEENE